MIFDTKVAILVLEDLETWQKLNVTAFLATGVAAGAPEALGEPYEDADGRAFGRMLGQPIMIYAATSGDLVRTCRQAASRDLQCTAYARAMFTTGHDAANRIAFKDESTEAPDFVGIAIRGAKKDVDKAVGRARLHA